MLHFHHQDWLKSVGLQAQDLSTSAAGLSHVEANARLAKFGKNITQGVKKPLLILQFLSRFRNPLVILLLVASTISAFTADLASFLIIASIVVFSVTLDFIQEYRAESAAAKLNRSAAIKATVIRDNKPSEINVALIVPGDVVLLSAGNLVPADGFVIESDDFFVNQALMTGESYPVEKTAKRTLMPDTHQDTAALDTLTHMVFAGTHVVSGSAKILICVTGSHTALGDIAKTLSASPPPTAFEQSIYKFGGLILRLTFFIVMFVLLVNLLLHRPWLDSFMFALALAVGLTPELLPMVVTVTLSRGAMRMSHQHVIVKRLAAIHNLGSMDVLCTDKTGTLTEAQIRLERHLDPAGADCEDVLLWAYLNSYFETGLKSPLDEAILQHKTLDISDWKKLDEVPFDFERRRVSVLLSHQGERYLVVKGAYEDIVKLCNSYTVSTETLELNANKLNELDSRATAMAQQGYRVLGIAWRKLMPEYSHAKASDETELVFAGFAAFIDPPKTSASTAIARLQKSGVTIKVITGDNELVTKCVCEQIGLNITGLLTGSEIAQMSDEALRAKVGMVNLFCRVTPALKSRVLVALKQQGHVVGYLGDGINDAPALHLADVSISVDTAVDVAKDAADLILLKHDLNVLHQGVIEGRRTFGNIMKYVMMGTSSNFGNMCSVAGAAVFLPFLPMLPIQILLNNLLYDLSEIAIPFDRVDEEYLRKPRRWDMSFIRNFMLVVGPVSSLFDFMTFYILLNVLGADESRFQTGWFMESILTQVLVIFVIRTRRNIWDSKPNIWLAINAMIIVLIALILPFTNLGTYFGFRTLPLSFFFILVILAIGYLVTVEFVKRLFYKTYHS